MMSLIAAAPIGYQLNGRTAELDNYTQWRLPYAAQLASGAQIAPLTDTQPVDELAVTKSGFAGGAFSDDWYHHIHIVPKRLDLGNLLSSQTRDVEVWNAFFEDRALNTLTATGADGISLQAPADPPTTFGPLESRTYIASIAIEGPPTIDASYVFDFDIGARDLTITGKRVVVFSLAPNWAQPVTERLEWLTDVLAAVDGSEQRAGLRAIPRRRFAYALLAQSTEGARLDGLLWAWQARVYGLPIWTDGQRLGAPLAAGSAAISVATANLDYHDGGLLVLLTDSASFEVAEIATVTTTSITLAKPMQNTWPAGTVILPMRLARLPAQVKLSRPTAAVVHGSVQFDATDNGGDAAAAEQSVDTYRGAPVFNRAPNRRDPLPESYLRTEAVIDNATGVITVDDIADQAIDQQRWSFLGRDKADIRALRAWLFARQGRLVPFWAPIWQAAITLTAPIGVSTPSITIKDIGYRLYNVNRPGRQDIALLHRDGTWYYRRVLTAVAGDPGEEILSLDSALGIAADPGDWRLVTYLVLARLEGDAITLTWHSSAIAEFSVPIRSVLQ